MSHAHHPAKNTTSCSSTAHSTTLTKRGIERRAAILQAANSLFLDKGFRAVSLDDIVMFSGGSKAAIYQYFGNKQGLLSALFEYRCENFFDCHPLPMYNPTDSLFHYMLSIATTLYAAFTNDENIAFMRLVVEESQHDPELAQLAYNSGPKRGLDFIANVLTQAHQAQTIFCPHPYASATLFFGMLRHTQWRLLVGLPPLEEHLDAAHYLHYSVERFLAGHAIAPN